MRILRVATEEVVMTFQAHTSLYEAYGSVIGSMDWSPDGELLLTTGMGRYQTLAEEGNRIVAWGDDDYTLKVWRCKWKKVGK